MSESSLTSGSEARGKPSGQQTKFIIGGIVVVAVVAYLIFTSISGSTAYYLTIGELKAKGADVYGKSVRVAGMVDGDTIDYNVQDLTLKFEISDESGTLPVVYHGPRPDMLRDEAEAVIEGKYTENGVFQANNLLLKCPSKYEEAATEQAGQQ